MTTVGFDLECTALLMGYLDDDHDDDDDDDEMTTIRSFCERGWLTLSERPC